MRLAMLKERYRPIFEKIGDPPVIDEARLYDCYFRALAYDYLLSHDVPWKFIRDVSPEVLRGFVDGIHASEEETRKAREAALMATAHPHPQGNNRPLAAGV